MWRRRIQNIKSEGRKPVISSNLCDIKWIYIAICKSIKRNKLTGKKSKNLRGKKVQKSCKMCKNLCKMSKNLWKNVWKSVGKCQESSGKMSEKQWENVRNYVEKIQSSVKKSNNLKIKVRRLKGPWCVASSELCDNSLFCHDAGPGSRPVKISFS